MAFILILGFPPLIMIHETEEYIIRGGFKEFSNLKTIASADPPRPDYFLTKGYEFWIKWVHGFGLYSGL